jgi:hypothetical protein
MLINGSIHEWGRESIARQGSRLRNVDLELVKTRGLISWPPSLSDIIGQREQIGGLPGSRGRRSDEETHVRVQGGDLQAQHYQIVT